MLDKDTIERAILARFPRAKLYQVGIPVPGLFTFGFQMGWLTVRLRFHEEARHNFIVVATPSPSSEILKSMVWYRKGESWDQALADLDLLRAELLGMSHGLQNLCRRP